MKKFILIILFLIGHLHLQAQTISGVVYRAGTDTSLPDVTVYYNGSTIGTITDQTGHFELPIKNSHIPLTVSCVGYYSVTLNDIRQDTVLKIYLKPKVESLAEVVISADNISREKKVEMFTKEFLGISDNALSCKITNIDDVNLVFNNKTKTLLATCSTPLIIENKRLGYTIKYYLDNFEKHPKTVLISGNYFFKDNYSVTNPISAQRNREKAFEGSRLQLIRALWDNTLKESDFKIYTADYKPLTADSILAKDSLNYKYIKIRKKIFVIYMNSAMEITSLTQNAEKSFIDGDGFYGAGLIWGGQLGFQRIGDLLPFEYISKKEINAQSGGSTKKPSALRNKTDNRKLEELKSIVMVQNNPIDERLVIRKWEQPIRYYLIGTSGKKAFDQGIDSCVHLFFSQLSKLINLDIQPSDTEADANFTVMIGKPSIFYKMISEDAQKFFKTTHTSENFYTFSDRGFTTVIANVRPDNIVRFQLLWYQVRTQILSGLGFFQHPLDSKRSLFYKGVQYWRPGQQIEDFDKKIFNALYANNIKSGMGEQDVNAILSQF